MTRCSRKLSINYSSMEKCRRLVAQHVHKIHCFLLLINNELHWIYILYALVRYMCACERETALQLVWHCLVPYFSLNSTIKKEISHHIKMPANAWSTKCRWNQKLIVQFCCTLRDKHFESN
jgi:hypothetical protein